VTDPLFAAIAVSVGPTLVGLAALHQATLGKREAAAANKAVNNVNPGDLRLVEKVDHFIVEVKDMRSDVAYVKRTLTEGVNRIAVVEQAVAHVADQATAAATLAAEVKADLDASHERADAVPPNEGPGAAADAAATTP
jgi:hypothetical protein